MQYYCDKYRHLICVPYSIPNLHAMAKDLGILYCWFHNDDRHPHYDIPKRRLQEIMDKCIVVTNKQILKLAKL